MRQPRPETIRAGHLSIVGNRVKATCGGHRETLPDQAVRKRERALPAMSACQKEVRKRAFHDIIEENALLPKEDCI